MAQRTRRLIAVLLLLLAIAAGGISIGPAPDAAAHGAWNSCSVTGWYQVWYSATRYADVIHEYHGPGPNGSYVIRHTLHHHPSDYWERHYVTCWT